MANTVLISGMQLEVNGESYESATIATMLQGLSIDRLVFSSPRVTREGSGEGFTIEGGLRLFEQDVAAVTLVAIVSGKKVTDFQLTVMLSSLTLGELERKGVVPPNIPGLALVQGIKFDDVELVFDSVDSQLYFGAPYSNAEVTEFRSLGLPLENLGFEYKRDYDTNKFLLLLHVTIRFGETQIEASINVRFDSNSAPGTWDLRVDTPIPLSAALRDVIAFLDGTPAARALGLSSFSSTFPDQVHELPTLFLDALSVSIDAVHMRLDYVSLALASVKPIQFGEGFAIQRAGFTMGVDLLSPSPGFTLMLFGTVKLSSTVTLELTVSVPKEWTKEDWEITANGSIELDGLASISGLPMNTGHADLALPDGFLTLKSLRLNVFELDFNPVKGKASRVHLDLAVFASCSLVHGLTFANPRLVLELADPFDKRSRTIVGEALGTIKIGDISFRISAEKSFEAWTFTGTTVDGTIKIGTLISSLASQFRISDVPEAVRGIEITKLTLTFTTGPGDERKDTASRELTFHLEGTIPVVDAKATATIDLRVSKQGALYTTRVSGTLAIPVTLASSAPEAVRGAEAAEPTSLDFSLVFEKGAQAKMVVAAFHSPQGLKIQVDELLGKFVDTSDVKSGLSFALKEALLAYYTKDEVQGDRTRSVSRLLFGLDIDGGLNLSDIKLPDLPLVGRPFPPDETLKLSVQLLASKEFAADDVAKVASLQGGGMSLPSAEIKGLRLAASLQVGSDSRTLSLPAAKEIVKKTGGPGGGTQVEMPAQGRTGADVVANDGTQWFEEIHKAFGPVHVERVGVKYLQDTKEIRALIDAALSVGGLTISLDGLWMSSPLTEFHPRFGLNGLGIDYRNGPVEIGGALLKRERKQGTTTTTSYCGLVVIRAQKLTLSAVGSYAELDGHPSLFVYAILDYPLGGPAFFFVTGLAAGFGYNRSLRIPEVEQVRSFPLVEEVLRDGGPRKAAVPAQPGADSLAGEMANLTQALVKLDDYIPQAVGEHFLAVGIRFTSFKVVDSFALLIIKFGHRLEIDLLGVSTLVMPARGAGKSAEPLAEAQLALKATFLPEDGILTVRAQLTPESYLFSRKCSLSGGAAFSCWFKDQPEMPGQPKIRGGDFVLTLGGYHPRFNVPAHYPQVPRLAMNWQVNEQLLLKGQAYFALTGHAIMAGGSLEGLWHSSDVKVWFKAGADFLMTWQPYHYDVEVYVSLGVDATFEAFGKSHLTFEAGANLRLWGPEFGGHADIELRVISIKIPLSIDFGSTAALPEPISWEQFKLSFLPRDEQVCTIAIQRGLIRQLTEKEGGQERERWIVDPKDFALAVDSVIPSTEVHVGGTPVIPSDSTINQKIGVAPVGLTTLSASLSVTITGPGGQEDIAFTPVLKSVPAGLWGPSETKTVSGKAVLEKPDINGETLMENALAGLVVRPKPPRSGTPHLIDSSKLLYETETVPEAFSWEDFHLDGQSGGWSGGDGFSEDDRKRQADVLNSLGLTSVDFDIHV